jgi:predicted PurR-regulated permease PerM
MQEPPTADNTVLGKVEEAAQSAPPPSPATVADPPHIDGVPIETPPAVGVVTFTSARPGAVSVEMTVRMASRAMYPFGWTNRDLKRSIALGLAGIVTLIFLWQVQSILPPFLIAFFLAALLDPTLRYLEQHGHSRIRAIMTLYLAGLSFVGVFFVFVVPVVRSQVQELSGNVESYYAQIQTGADAWMLKNQSILQKFNVRQHRVADLMSQQTSPVRNAINVTLVTVTATLGSMASKAAWLIIIPLTCFFFMRDYPVLRARIIALFPEPYQDQIDVVSRDIVDIFTAYLRGLAKVCALYAVVATLLFSLLGVKYALFLGLMAGVLYAVPYVGQLITALSCGIVAYTMTRHNIFFVIGIDAHSLQYAIMVVVIAIVVQNVFDQILYPRIVGGSVGLHPVVSIFALMAGATLFNIWGMLIAVPVAASIQILLTFFFPKLTQKPPARLVNSSLSPPADAT